MAKTTQLETIELSSLVDVTGGVGWIVAPMAGCPKGNADQVRALCAKAKEILSTLDQ